MGPNPREGETIGELTENGEPMTLVGLLGAELLGCWEDIALIHRTRSHQMDYQSEGDNQT